MDATKWTLSNSKSAMTSNARSLFYATLIIPADAVGITRRSNAWPISVIRIIWWLFLTKYTAIWQFSATNTFLLRTFLRKRRRLVSLSARQVRHLISPAWLALTPSFPTSSCVRNSSAGLMVTRSLKEIFSRLSLQWQPISRAKLGAGKCWLT